MARADWRAFDIRFVTVQLRSEELTANSQQLIAHDFGNHSHITPLPSGSTTWPGPGGCVS